MLVLQALLLASKQSLLQAIKLQSWIKKKQPFIFQAI